MFLLTLAEFSKLLRRRILYVVLLVIISVFTGAAFDRLSFQRYWNATLQEQQAAYWQSIQELHANISRAERESSGSSAQLLSMKRQLANLEAAGEPKAMESTPWAPFARIYVSLFGAFLLLPSLLILGGALSLGDEFQSKSIKLLLMQPITRRQVFVAKWLSLVLYAALSLPVLFIISYFVSGSILGFGGWNVPASVITGTGEHAPHMSAFSYISAAVAYQIVGSILMGTLSLSLSVIAQNTLMPFAIASGVGLLGLNLEFSRSSELIRPLLFTAHLPFNSHWAHSAVAPPAISIIVLSGYTLTFFYIGMRTFERKDILT